MTERSRHKDTTVSQADERAAPPLINKLLADNSWNVRNNKRLKREAAAQGEILSEPTGQETPLTFSDEDRREVAEYLLERRVFPVMKGPDSALRTHQQKGAGSGGRSESGRGSSPKRAAKRHHRSWGDMEGVVDRDFGGLTHKPCDFGMHPVYAAFMKRSSLQLRHLLWFARYVPQRNRELQEWRDTVAELQAGDRERGAGEVGNNRKFGDVEAYWSTERLPKCSAEDFGVSLESAAELSTVANWCCAAYVWYASRLLAGVAAPSSSIDAAANLTSSVEECGKLTALLRDRHPSATLLSLIGGAPDEESVVDGVAVTRSVLRPILGASVDQLSDADVQRSGIAQLGRILRVAQESPIDGFERSAIQSTEEQTGLGT